MPSSDDAVRFLRALAFEIHRKTPPDQALADCIEKEGRSGRHRQFRAAAEALESDGFVAALLAAGMLGEEAAAVLAPLVAGRDHRQISAALGNLADYRERTGDGR